VDTISRAREGLDVFVCNAGGSIGRDQAPHVSAADLESALRQNVTTTLVCAQVAARAMAPRRRGAIVTVGSIHGSLGSDRRLYAPGFPRSPVLYHAAKGAIINLTRALACEFAQYQITVNCISPGQIPKQGVDRDTYERLRRAVPLGRLGRPEDLKGAVALLATESGRWITGQNLIVDGGWSAW
jgi:gluconate 5-dehydrogenase